MYNFNTIKKQSIINKLIVSIIDKLLDINNNNNDIVSKAITSLEEVNCSCGNSKCAEAIRILKSYRKDI